MLKMLKSAPSPSGLGKKVHTDSLFLAAGKVERGRSLPLVPPHPVEAAAALLCPREGAALPLPTSAEEGNCCSVPALRAELPGGIIGSAQVFRIWFPILSFILLVFASQIYQQLPGAVR